MSEIEVNLSEKQIRLLEEIAREKGMSLQELLNSVAEETIRAVIAVQPRNGQHR